MKKLLKRLRHLAAEARYSLCRLNEIQFSAPWAPKRPRCR